MMNGRKNMNPDNMEEKYYTPSELIEELFKLKDKYCDVEITEYLENSAGSGNIIKYFDKPYIAFDIINETNHPHIKECNYLKEEIEYKPGRVAVINPPFMKGLKFVYKALKECDWVFCVLPQNSIINMDYSKVWAEEIQFYKKYKFSEETQVSITLMALRNKKETDKYEYD